MKDQAHNLRVMKFWIDFKYELKEDLGRWWGTPEDWSEKCLSMPSNSIVKMFERGKELGIYSDELSDKAEALVSEILKEESE